MQFTFSKKSCKVIKPNAKKFDIIYIHLWCKYGARISPGPKWSLITNEEKESSHNRCTHTHNDRDEPKQPGNNKQQVFCLLPNCTASSLLLLFLFLHRLCAQKRQTRQPNLDYFVCVLALVRCIHHDNCALFFGVSPISIANFMQPTAEHGCPNQKKMQLLLRFRSCHRVHFQQTSQKKCVAYVGFSWRHVSVVCRVFFSLYFCCPFLFCVRFETPFSFLPLQFWWVSCVLLLFIRVFVYCCHSFLFLSAYTFFLVFVNS